MAVVSDTEQRLMEIEHALSKHFAHPSTVISHAADSSGAVTIQVSWVAVPRTTRILDERCVLNLAIAPDVLDRYASLDGAGRRRMQEALCVLAVDEVRRHVPMGALEIVDCNLDVDVNAAMLELLGR